MSKSFFSRLRLIPFNIRKPAPRGEQRVAHVMDQVHRETRDQLLASLSRMLEPALAEEVLQEAYLKLLLALREDRAPEPRPFLFRVARNLAISHLRRQAMAARHDGSVRLVMSHGKPCEAVESRISREQERDLLLAAINALPPKCRQIFVMRKIDGMSHSQISDVLGVSVKTVENHLARGMRLCREHIVSHAKAQNTQTPAETMEAPQVGAG